MKTQTNTRRKRFLCTLLCALMLTAQVTPGYGEDEIPAEATAYAEETSTVEETFYAEETGMDEETAEEEVLLPAAAQAAVVQSDRMATSADVVIFAYFTDDTAESASAYFNEQGKYSTFKKYFMGDHGRSFANYMSAISYGQFTVNVCMPQEQTDGTIVPVALPVSQAKAKQENVDAQILQAVMDGMPDLADLAVDRNKDGYIDNITIVCKAESCSTGVTGGASLVAHANTSGNQGTTWGYGVSSYNIISTDRLEVVQSGLIAHEYLHTLGYPDLYRTDGREDSPVYLWDIMGGVSAAPGYPLAYLRSQISQWFSIETASENGTYTLNSQRDSSGNKALILKSPLRDTELFVVEYRQRPSDIYDENTLDRGLTGSGMIVYRVDTTVEEYSNAHGQTGIYVFRPQAGQNGYVDGNERVTVTNAYLSAESGRTVIGSADMSAGLTDGALTFSDGTNSGIVISNVGSAAGDTISFSLTYPDLSAADLWEDAAFSSQTGNMNEKIGIAILDDQLLALEYDGSGFTAYRQINGVWERASTKLNVSSSTFNGQMKMIASGGTLYLAYGDWDAKLYLKKLDIHTQNWSSVTTAAEKGENFDLTVVDGELYISYGSSSLKLAKFTGSAFRDLGEAYSSSWLMGASKMMQIDGIPYLFGRDASGNKLVGFSYQNSGFVKIVDAEITGNTFDVMEACGKIYLSYVDSSDSTLGMAVYDGSGWTVRDSDIDSSDVVLVQSRGNVYVLSSPGSGTESFRMYRFDGEQYLQEGDTVIDAASTCFSALNFNDTLYLSYVRSHDYKSFVKCKKPQDSHSWDNGVITEEATCTRAGEKTFTCEDCGAIRTEVLPRISHVTLYKGVNKTYLLSSGSWTMSKSRVAYRKGSRIYVKKTGVITVKDKITGVSVTINIVAPVLSLNASKITLKKGTTFRVTTDVVPQTQPTFSSSRKSVAAVDSSGLITAKKKGKTTIRVKANGVTKKIAVTVVN